MGRREKDGSQEHSSLGGGRYNFAFIVQFTYKLEMWANAQYDGRPAEHRWRPLLNAAKFGWHPLLDPCSKAAKTRNPLKFVGVPQTRQQISAVSWPKFTILWGHVEDITALQVFFRLSICALVAKIQPNKVVRWCPDGDFLAIFWVLHFQRAARSTFQTCILNLH